MAKSLAIIMVWSIATLCASSQSHKVAAGKRSDTTTSATTSNASASQTVPSPSTPSEKKELAAQARTVQYHAQDVVTINGRVNFTTLIVLPQGEEIMDAATGDKEFWIIDVAHNNVFVHPAKEGIESNLNLITARGTVYSFILKDVSETSIPADVKVSITPVDRSSLVETSQIPVQYVPATTVENMQRKVAAIEQQAVAAIDEYKASYPSKVVLDYSFRKDEKPFYVESIYHDDKFTYIKVGPRNNEKFAVYEIRDGKPDLITYELKDGVYVITHIMDKGYLRIGKKQTNFERKG
jgi:type IV secretion system protein VirB9